MKHDMAMTYIGYYWGDCIVYLKTREALALHIQYISLII